MADSLDDLILTQKPTVERPLLGLMVLVVEDSRFACEALRLVCQLSGARIRRAESLASAARHLAAYRPQVAVVDLGLPDGSGLDLVAKMSVAEPRIQAIIATSGDDTRKDQALAAGADAFLPKPLTSVIAFQALVLGLFDVSFEQGPTDTTIDPDRLALKDDLAHARSVLGGHGGDQRRAYVSAFLRGLAQSADDSDILDIARRTEAGDSDLDARLADRIAGMNAP